MATHEQSGNEHEINSKNTINNNKKKILADFAQNFARLKIDRQQNCSKKLWKLNNEKLLQPSRKSTNIILNAERIETIQAPNNYGHEPLGNK